MNAADGRARSIFEASRRAFSLRRNLRTLFVPPEGHLRALDGMRALSILWVVAFHAGWYAAPYIPTPIYAAMLSSPSMLPVWRGDFGVDVFFVLSGFLIAGLLIDQRERTGRIELTRFYVRRLLRLWPTLCIAALLDVLLIGDNASMIWANLFYVSNFVPILQAAMGWTWSLAIEEQFYLVCPWLVIALTRLGDRARLATIAGIVLALVGVAVYVARSGSFFAIDVEIVVNRDFIRWTEGFDHIYVKPWMRAAPLLVGVAAAYCYRMKHVMEALARRRVASAVLMAFAFAVAVASTLWQLVVGAPRAIEVAYIASFRATFGLSVGYLLLFSLSRHPIGRVLSRLLSSRYLYPIGQLAYGAYLINPIVCTLVHRATAVLVWEGRASPMQTFLPLDVAGTFVGAAALYLFVERPFMDLRPSAAARGGALPPHRGSAEGARS